MKKKSSLFLLLAIIPWISGFLWASQSPDAAVDIPYPEGCTTILVGRKASDDGSVMACQTADCGVCDFTWHVIPAADHPQGALRKIYHINQIKTWPPEEGGKWYRYKENDTGLEIPQPAHTYAYQYGIFGHMNEHQLSIQESTIGCRKKLRNDTPSAKMDIVTLTRLAMERCTTAREAIRLMGDMATRHGYGFHDSGEMLAVSDPEEIWIFEIMPVGPLWTPESGKPGAVWCAQRVPDHHVSFCPNESRIGEIDLENKGNFMASSNVISLAVEKGYYDPSEDHPFSWKHAYSPSKGSPSATGGRRGRLWRLLCLAAPSRNFSPETETMDFPFSVKPDRKLSLQNLMEMTRDRYRNTSFDPAEGLKGGPFANPNYFRGVKWKEEKYPGPRSISINNAEYTSITQCRSWLPDPVGGINWIALGSQDTSCYLPFYSGILSMPESFTIGDHFAINRKSARWAFDYVDFHTQVVYSLAIQDVRKVRKEWEEWAFQRVAEADKTALKLYRNDPRKAADFLTLFCRNLTENVLRAWWRLGDELLVKYNHLRVYDAMKRKSRRIEYPDWWKEQIIRYHELQPLPGKKKNSGKKEKPPSDG